MGINSETQGLFAEHTAVLIQRAVESGFRLTYAWAYRPPWVQTIFWKERPNLRAHIEGVLRRSGIIPKDKNLPVSSAMVGLHPQRQAVDFNLFIQNETGAWVYQRTSEAHRPLGIHWESLSPYNRWGGRFKDGNHYERRPFPWQERPGFVPMVNDA